jgi:hypothetical protein
MEQLTYSVQMNPNAKTRSRPFYYQMAAMMGRRAPAHKGPPTMALGININAKMTGSR